MDFFLNVTVPKILTLKRDAVFWVELVPCLAEFNPIFRHLVVAIAATHESLFHNDCNQLNIFVLTQCNKAIQHLQSLRSSKLSLIVVSCILVSAYNLLRCDFVSADKSIESGLEMVIQNEKLRQIVSGPLDRAGTAVTRHKCSQC